MIKNILIISLFTGIIGVSYIAYKNYCNMQDRLAENYQAIQQLQVIQKIPNENIEKQIDQKKDKAPEQNKKNIVIMPVEKPVEEPVEKITKKPTKKQDNISFNTSLTIDDLIPREEPKKRVARVLRKPKKRIKPEQVVKIDEVQPKPVDEVKPEPKEEPKDKKSWFTNEEIASLMDILNTAQNLLDDTSFKKNKAPVKKEEKHQNNELELIHSDSFGPGKKK